jgi:hypothetical protein
LVPLREKLHSKTRFIAENRKEQSAFTRTRRKESKEKNVFDEQQHKWRDFSPSRVDDKA